MLFRHVPAYLDCWQCAQDDPVGPAVSRQVVSGGVSLAVVPVPGAPGARVAVVCETAPPALRVPVGVGGWCFKCPSKPHLLFPVHPAAVLGLCRCHCAAHKALLHRGPGLHHMLGSH
jgi:hypothetical protein